MRTPKISHGVLLAWTTKDIYKKQYLEKNMIDKDYIVEVIVIVDDE